LLATSGDAKEDARMPPRGAKSAKRERQYEHIKDAELKQGRSTKRAKQIAAATVNKQRRQSGETKTSRSRKSSGGGRKKTASRSTSSTRSGSRKTSSRKTTSRKTTSRKTGARKK
jgi:hypothetical protein